MKVEFYKSVLDRDHHVPMEIEEIRNYMLTDVDLRENTKKYHELYSQIKTEDDKKRCSFIKSRLFNAIQVAGLFKNRGTINDFYENSGLICMDIDHLKGRIQEVFSLLKEDPFTFWLFVSPSGEGLKLIFKHNLTYPQNWVYLHDEIAYHLKEKYGITVDNTSDISRNCFLPAIDEGYDYYNPDSLIWRYEGDFEKSDDKISEIPIEIDERRRERCKLLGRYLRDNKINICEDYDTWYRLGFSLAVLGEEGRQIFHDISSASKKYSKNQVNDKFDMFLLDLDAERTNISFYQRNAENGMVLYVLHTIYGYEI